MCLCACVCASVLLYHTVCVCVMCMYTLYNMCGRAVRVDVCVFACVYLLSFFIGRFINYISLFIPFMTRILLIFLHHLALMNNADAFSPLSPM